MLHPRFLCKCEKRKVSCIICNFRCPRFIIRRIIGRIPAPGRQIAQLATPVRAIFAAAQHAWTNLKRVAVNLTHRDFGRKLLGKKRCAERVGNPVKQRDVVRGAFCRNHGGRAPFGRSPRRSSVTMLWHGSLLAACARPKSAPSRWIRLTATRSNAPEAGLVPSVRSGRIGLLRRTAPRAAGCDRRPPSPADRCCIR